MAVVLAAVGVAGAFAATRGSWHASAWPWIGKRSPAPDDRPTWIVSTCFVASLGYLAFLLLVKALVDEGDIDYRLMLPVQVLCIIAGVSLISRVTHDLRRRPERADLKAAIATSGVLLALLPIGFNGLATVHFALERRADELGPMPRLSTSPVTRRLIATLPRGAWVASYDEHSKVIAARGGFCPMDGPARELATRSRRAGTLASRPTRQRRRVRRVRRAAEQLVQATGRRARAVCATARSGTAASSAGG